MGPQAPVFVNQATIPGVAPIPQPQPILDWGQVFAYFSNFYANPTGFGVIGEVLHFIGVFFSFLSIFFMLVIIFVVIRRNRLFAYEKTLYNPEPKKEEDEEEKPESDHPRFDKVLGHINTQNPSEWRMAIIEADNILYEILRRAGYPGDTLGEMLSNANQANFQTIESAWEAHKIRNMIAHESAEYPLTQRGARRVIGLYEKVFREFEYL